VKGPPVVDWKSAHPLLRFVNFDNVQVAESLGVKPPPWGIALVESPQTPLIIAGELNRQRIVWVGFDPLQSTWPLRISFPIFMANAVDWLNPSSANNNQSLVQAGQAFRMPLASGTTTAQLTSPDGKTRMIAIEPGERELVIGETFQQGAYRVKAGTNEVTFCVNLLDSSESAIQPRDELPIGKYAKVTATTVKRANMELWRWIAAVGLLVLMFEWWWYHKRTA
jgi:Ca-activated chloride channel homolog